MQRRPEFSFPGSPARGPDRAPPPVNAAPPRPREEEEVRWLQASQQGSPDCYYHSSSGTPSPQLWAPRHDEHQHRFYPASAGSSPSRAQAIAGYRREMLDLVRGLPESAYELSLRDIVEHRPSSSSSPPSSALLPTPPTLPPPPSNTAVARGHDEPANAAEAGTADEQAAKQSKKQGRKQQRAVRRQRSRSLERSVSLDTGLLIKFFVPFSIAGRGGKKKVSPKPDAKDAKKKTKQGTSKKEEARQKQDEEWWTKSEFSEASGSSSRTSSTARSNSDSSNGSIRNGLGNGSGSNPKAPIRTRSRKRNGCYAFLRGNKTKNGVSQD